MVPAERVSVRDPVTRPRARVTGAAEAPAAQQSTWTRSSGRHRRGWHPAVLAGHGTTCAGPTTVTPQPVRSPTS